MLYLNLLLLINIPVVVLLLIKKFYFNNTITFLEYIKYLLIINLPTIWFLSTVLNKVNLALDFNFAFISILDNWLIYSSSCLVIMLGVLAYTYSLTKLEVTKQKTNTKSKWMVVLLSCILFLGCLFFGLTKYFIDGFGNISPEQMVYNLVSPLTGIASNQIVMIMFGPVLNVVVPVVFFIWWLVANKEYLFNNKVVFNYKNKIRLASVVSLCVLVFGSTYMYENLSMDSLRKQMFLSDNFIQTHYVSPNDVVIKPPAKPRNFIHLYLESMETTYLDKANGGYFDDNLIPELTKIANEEDSIVFSNDESKFGGATQVFGSSWSIAGMVNASSGVPLKVPGDGNDYGKSGEFLPGLVNNYDILSYQGYNQELMVGADAKFGGLDTYFTKHGDFKIFDIFEARKEGLVPPDYNVNWGFEDKKLFGFAKDELTRLSKEDKPFNFVMETADTHFPDGTIEPGDPQPFDKKYANSIYNSDRRSAEFIRWCQQQPWYENTTIFVQGDHLSMDVEFFKGMDKDYQRKTFNMVINPVDKDTTNINNRQFAVFDYMPTILSAMGYEIEGNRLGLGTNLFSGEPTLLEQLGAYDLDEGLKRHSPLFDHQFLNPQRRITYTPKKQ